jgi:hypothetical protein
MTNHRLKVGYEPFENAAPGFLGNLDMLLGLFKVDFVRIDHFHPLIRNASTGEWTGAFGWLQNGSVDMLEDFRYITEERIDSFRFTNPIVEGTFGAIYSVAGVHASVIKFDSMMANIQVNVYILLLAVGCVLIALYLCVDRIDSDDHTDWWAVLVAVVPCFNSQATLEARGTVTRRVIFVVIGIYVLITTTFYQTNLLRSLILSAQMTPLTTKQIIAGVERHEYTIMFDNQGSALERWIRLKKDSETTATTRT